ncbi:MAG: COX15/CtaA family protein [Thermonemataceae bacterium]|nr:COX15/CtaA family protein [Thermonemataceae bacterium]
MQKFFIQLSWATIIAVYLLILVGGIVRSTGSGMGCPDWPKCFGQLVPPTDKSQLPENYKDIFAQKRKEKNIRLVGFLRTIGMKEAAERVQNDESIYIEEDFSVRKTWIEYLNRLLGVLVGLLIFGTFIASLSYIKTKLVVPILSFSALILVGFQGWIGSIVVSTNLLQGMITLHMFLAILQVLLMAYTTRLATNEKGGNFATINWRFSVLLWANIIFSFGQVLLGTQVRESIDAVAQEMGISQKNIWIENLDWRFLVHRSFSLFLLGLNIFLLYQLKKQPFFAQIQRIYYGLLSVIALSVISGAIMAYFAIPAFAQPIHLLLAVVMMGLEWEIWLRIKKTSL